MKLRVFTEQPLNVTNLKKIINIINNARCFDLTLKDAFPQRYKSIAHNTKFVNVYLDSLKAKEHCYEWSL